jgi:COP9 signalosome complex subunit 2
MISCKTRIKSSITTPSNSYDRATNTGTLRYDFEFEDDGEEESGDVDIENKYYNAKQMKVNNPEEAIEEFLSVPALEEEKNEWGFKGLKQAIKLEYKLGLYREVFCGPYIV